MASHAETTPLTMRLTKEQSRTLLQAKHSVEAELGELVSWSLLFVILAEKRVGE